MKTLLYYTSTSYLDCALEVVSLLKKDFEIHLLIELKYSTTSNNILSVNDLPTETFADILTVVENQQLDHLRPYLEGCASASFFIHHNDSPLSIVGKSLDLWRFVRRINPDFIHVEAIDLRALGLLPFVLRKRTVLAIHDAVPHLGENGLKVWLPRWLFLYLPYKKRLAFFSEFSRSKFKENNKGIKSPTFVIRMATYSFFRRLRTEKKERKHILFFGRISPYKGVSVLLRAIPAVLKEPPNEIFIIAGRGIDGYNPSYQALSEHPDNLNILNRYIGNSELVNLIQGAKFVVCPYLEASQSGVLMTSFALDTPVVATSVGAFPEYISENHNGLLIPPDDPVKLADAIKEVLGKEMYKRMEKEITSMNTDVGWSENNPELALSYLNM
jgi:glycosyltransferase involved in cell wall biosynthesis